MGFKNGEGNMKTSLWMDEPKYLLSETTYDELSRTLTDFENADDDPCSEDYLSDGEWLDIFYRLCCKMQSEMNK